MRTLTLALGLALGAFSFAHADWRHPTEAERAMVDQDWTAALDMVSAMANTAVCGAIPRWEVDSRIGIVMNQAALSASRSGIDKFPALLADQRAAAKRGYDAPCSIPLADQARMARWIEEIR